MGLLRMRAEGTGVSAADYRYRNAIPYPYLCSRKNSLENAQPLYGCSRQARCNERSATELGRGRFCSVDEIKSAAILTVNASQVAALRRQ